MGRDRDGQLLTGVCEIVSWRSKIDMPLHQIVVNPITLQQNNNKTRKVRFVCWGSEYFLCENTVYTWNALSVPWIRSPKSCLDSRKNKICQSSCWKTMNRELFVRVLFLLCSKAMLGRQLMSHLYILSEDLFEPILFRKVSVHERFPQQSLDM